MVSSKGDKATQSPTVKKPLMLGEVGFIAREDGVASYGKGRVS